MRCGIAGAGAISPMHFENADVSLVGLVAVAVITWPTGTPAPKTTDVFPVPVEPVVIAVAPNNTSPSPNPDGSQAALLNTSMLKVVFGAADRLSQTVVVMPD